MALKIEQHPCWVAECDRCGEGDCHDYGSSYHHPSEEVARESLAGMDWIVLSDGRALCLECFEELRPQVRCPHGAGCTNGGCGACPTDEQVFALGEPQEADRG